VIKSAPLIYPPANPLSEDIRRLTLELQERDLDLEIQCQAMRDTLGELEESRNRYAALYDFSPVGYVTFDEKGCIQEINLTGAALLGMERSRLFGMAMTAFVDKDSCKPFLDHLRSCRLSGGKVTTEITLKTKNTGAVYAELVSLPLLDNRSCGLQYWTVIGDISERKLVEREMARLERLNLIGEMAAGIAHEIRNPMTTVRGYLQSFQQKPEFSQFNSRFDLMIEELDRTNSIITEFLSLAKNKAIDRSPQNLNTIIETLLPLMESDALIHGKWILVELSTDLPVLLLDAQEIRQLILNLVRNGLEAMPPGGQIRIATFTEDGQVILAIQDQGTGIPAAVMEKLGTPFITTKENGTGLGIAICYSIAGRHNAKIEVLTGESGTTFNVRFMKPL
jgi:PAS domain S-box-containing protein